MVVVLLLLQLQLLFPPAAAAALSRLCCELKRRRNGRTGMSGRKSQTETAKKVGESPAGGATQEAKRRARADDRAGACALKLSLAACADCFAECGAFVQELPEPEPAQPAPPAQPLSRKQTTKHQKRQKQKQKQRAKLQEEEQQALLIDEPSEEPAAKQLDIITVEETSDATATKTDSSAGELVAQVEIVMETAESDENHVTDRAGKGADPTDSKDMDEGGNRPAILKQAAPTEEVKKTTIDDKLKVLEDKFVVTEPCFGTVDEKTDRASTLQTQLEIAPSDVEDNADGACSTSAHVHHSESMLAASPASDMSAEKPTAAAKGTSPKKPKKKPKKKAKKKAKNIMKAVGFSLQEDGIAEPPRFQQMVEAFPKDIASPAAMKKDIASPAAMKKDIIDLVGKTKHVSSVSLLKKPSSALARSSTKLQPKNGQKAKLQEGQQALLIDKPSEEPAAKPLDIITVEETSNATATKLQHGSPRASGSGDHSLVAPTGWNPGEQVHIHPREKSDVTFPGPVDSRHSFVESHDGAEQAPKDIAAKCPLPVPILHGNQPAPAEHAILAQLLTLTDNGGGGGGGGGNASDVPQLTQSDTIKTPPSILGFTQMWDIVSEKTEKQAQEKVHAEELESAILIGAPQLSPPIEKPAANDKVRSYSVV